MQFSFVADRYQYLAGIGIIAILVGGAACGVGKLPDATRVGIQAAVVVLVLAVLGTLTWKQAGIYRDNGAFYEHILSLNPQAKGGHHNLGDWLVEQGRVGEALAAYRVAMSQSPKDVTVPNQMGVAFGKLGQHQKEEEQYRHALRINPNYVFSMSNLALLLVGQQQYEKALELYRGVIEINPEYANTYSNMGFALAKLNRLEEALRSFEHALKLDPSLKEARDNRDKARQALQSKNE